MLNGRRAAAIVPFLLTSAVVLKSALCITIDNQLQVIRNDCYERLAIGQRLDKKDVYREIDSKTIMDCQMECTQDEEKCKSFSFGIGVKGNASCELSSHVVKETIDLKPIGTTDDTDFDLYIKKLGCKLVIDMQPNLPEFISDEPYEPIETDKPKHRPRPGSYKKHQSGFQYGTEHQSSYNSQSHWTMKKLYKGNRPINDDDRAVSYNRYEKPSSGNYDKPSKYGVEGDKSNSYDNSDQFSFTNPYDDIDGPTYYKPLNRPSSEQNKRKPLPSRYGNNDDKPPNSGYENDGNTRPNSGYGIDGNTRPNSGYGNDGNTRPNSGYENDGNTRPNSGYENDGNTRPNSGYGNDGNTRPNSGNGNDGNTRPNSGYENDGNTRPNSGYENDGNTRPNSGYGNDGNTRPNPGYENDGNIRPNSGYGNDGNIRPASGYDNSNPSSSGYDSYKPSNKPSYDPNPKPPFRPTHLDNPYGNQFNDFLQIPSRPQHSDPDNPNYESHRPSRPSHGENLGDYDHEKPYKKPPKFEDAEGYEYSKPPPSGGHNYGKPFELRPAEGYDYPKQGKPSYDSVVKPIYEMESDTYEHPQRPNFPGGLYGLIRPPRPGRPGRPGGSYNGIHYDVLPEIYSPTYPYQDPIIKDTVDPYGHLVTSIITEVGNVCFRRALAGKRVSRIFVRRAVSCERVEHCQQECAEEKRFICEGFNYRLDPSGHGRGDCELLDVPYVRLDLRRDVIANPDYDYYEKDRNCKEHQSSPPFRPSGGDRLPGPPRTPLHDWYSSSSFDHYGSRDRFRDRYDERTNFDRRGSEYDLRPPLSGPYNRRNDYYEESVLSRDKYEDHYNSHDYYSYHHSIPDLQPGKYYGYKSDEPHLPPRNKYDHTDYWINDKPYYDKGIDRPPYDNSWGLYGGNYGDFGRGHTDYRYIDKNYNFKDIKYDFPRPSSPKNWGAYGGNYGTGGYYHTYQANDYWGLDKANEHKFTSTAVIYDGSELHYKPSQEYLPPTIPTTPGYLPPHDVHGYNYGKPETGNVGYPREPSITISSECSLRSATGYRLYKSIVKKILTVPTINDCEFACYTQKDFICTSYAFRYIIGADIPPNNCYLSNKNYKELDYYTDLEQDRNFDIYTMNDRDRCDESPTHPRDSSECFLHVRSGQRFDDKCVRGSLVVKSMVDCELACLKSTHFICRTFSFRYGSAVIGGIVDNCLLTDVPYHELDPMQDFIFDPGFIIYERASFGYGCELNQLPNLHKPKPSTATLSDEICYVGFGWPANLTPQAIKKVLRVSTELECKLECTRARLETPFCCMTFSYKSTIVKNEPNCFLSDIFQRDLLENIDYIRSSDHWLFSWDNTKPQCNFPPYYEQQLSFDERYDIFPGSLTWRIYSVGGWPCKRGTSCKQSELGFWFCELEGGSPSSWDYCCRPKHQCGYSEGFPYQWCYVGPSSTQWRKCNDKYYPYLPSPRPPEHYIPTTPAKPTFVPHIPYKPSPPDYDNKLPTYVPSTFIPPPISHIEPPKKTYLPPSFNKPRPWITAGKPIQSGLQPPIRPGFRPDRPQAASPPYKPKPTLDQYEEQFDSFFLDPPKPGGFGQARHWPVSYLHKEMPPNTTTPFEQRLDRIEMRDDIPAKPRSQAIQNLIEVIKVNDLDNIKYQISNTSANRGDDVLHVQIPLPSKFLENRHLDGKEQHLISQAIDLIPQSQNSITTAKITNGNNVLNPTTDSTNAIEKHNVNRNVYRRGFIQKTNVTGYGRSLRFL